MGFEKGRNKDMREHNDLISRLRNGPFPIIIMDFKDPGFGGSTEARARLLTVDTV